MKDTIVTLAKELPALWIEATKNDETPDKAAAWRRLDAIERFILTADATTLEGAAAQLIIARNVLNHVNPEDADGDPKCARIIQEDLDLVQTAISSALAAMQKATGLDVRVLCGPDYFTADEMLRFGVTAEQLIRMGYPAPAAEPVAEAA